MHSWIRTRADGMPRPGGKNAPKRSFSLPIRKLDVTDRTHSRTLDKVPDSFRVGICLRASSCNSPEVHACVR